MESSRQIEDRAAAWLAQREGGNWTASDQAQLTEWLDASSHHRVAFLRLEAGWEKSSRLKVFAVRSAPGYVPPRGRWQLSAFFSHRTRGGTNHDSAASDTTNRQHSLRRRTALAIAATVLLAIGAGTYLTLHTPGERYTTPIGGVASIPLRDGSQVTLNTASRIHVTLTETERHVELESGEAFFDIAKDPSRPFVVVAGNRRIIAVGTQFSVRRNVDDVQVIVTEGKVRLETSGLGTQQPTLLSAGGIAELTKTAVALKNQDVPKIEDTLSWRTGYLTFDDVRLADAIAEFNRYNTQKIYIEDPALAGIRISGKFRATNSGDFIHLLRTGFAIQTRQTDDSTYLVAN
jgi:transmembrane sensor